MKITNKEKYLERLSGRESDSLKAAKSRVQNRYWLKYSQKIALKILVRLEELGWKKNTLANKLGVSLDQVGSMVKGSEKFEFDVLVKLQEVLNISIFSWNEEQITKANLENSERNT